jgi:hypothetical protein
MSSSLLLGKLHIAQDVCSYYEFPGIVSRDEQIVLDTSYHPMDREFVFIQSPTK